MTPEPDATRTSPLDATRTADDGPTRTGAVPPDDETQHHPGGTPGTLDAPPGFEIDRELSRGGMGVVFLARQLGLNRPVALKLIQAGDTGSALRFLAEAEAMAVVRHPHVAEVYQFGEYHGRPFLALEYCPGGDLTSRLRAGKLSPTDAAKLLVSIAEGVAAAHAAGIVHRDLKPHNVLLTVNGTPKVTDFGLAKRHGGSDLTKTNAIMGTPAYMPPEQAKGETKFVGPPADVWALGVMLYEAVCGVRPFTGADHWAVLAAVQRGTFAPPRSVEKDIPRDLELICLKCLKLEPHERYPSAAELAADLHHWLDGKPISARPVWAIEQATKWAKRNKRLALMGAAVLLTMAAATGVSLGFGLEANEQRKTAVAAVKTANDEKKAAVEARNDLTVANTKTEQALAQALLGPISAERRPDDPFRTTPSEYERETFWRLTSLRHGSIANRFFEEATADPLPARKFRCRAELLTHAALGLDRQRRDEVTVLLANRFADPALAAGAKRDVAITCIHAGLVADLTVATAIADGFQSEADHTGWHELAVGLASVCERLPAHTAADLCRRVADVLLTELKRPTTRPGQTNWAAVGQALAAVVEQLPPEEAGERCGRAAEWFSVTLRGSVPSHEWTPFAEGLVAVSGHVPAAQAAKLLLAAARVDADGYGWRLLAHPLARVAGRLPPEEAATLTETVGNALLAALQNPTTRYGHDYLAEAMVTISHGRSPADTARWCVPAADTLLTMVKKAESSDSASEQLRGLAVLAPRLPVDGTAGPCGEAADAVMAKADQADLPSTRAGWLLQLEIIAGKLRPPHAARLSDQLAATVWRRLKDTTDPMERGQLATAVAKVCRWATPLATIDPLLLAIRNSNQQHETEVLLNGLAVLALRLPAERAVEVIRTALPLFRTHFDKVNLTASRRQVARCVVRVAERLPAGEAVTACSDIADRLLTAFESAQSHWDWQTLTDGLTEVVSGVGPRGGFHLAHGEVVASLAGSLALHPDVLPKPRPLPPQKLVELLKHPFCVKEARRAVLDALEFTYDRKFADLWEFVAYAEKEHPELDLLTPPKRPEKK